MTTPSLPAPRSTSDLVDLVALEPGIALDIRYARHDNFLGRPVYPADAGIFLQRHVAKAVVLAHRELAASGFGLLVFDGYRPWSVTRELWDSTGEDVHPYLANPERGSKHNRGCAVDVTLMRLDDRREVVMPSGFDEFNERAHADYAGGDAQARQRRDLLRRTMEDQGFAVNPVEWWHFDHHSWEDHPVMDVTFESLRVGDGS